MKRIINKGYESLTEFITGIPAGTFEYSGETIHKGRNCVKVFEADGRKVVVKRFKVPNIFNRIIYMFIRGSKAERAYRNALQLDSLGVATPVPIAFIDIRKGGLLAYSYLVTEYTDYAAVKDMAREDRIYQVLGFNALVAFTADLHRKGVKHKDFNNSNIRYKRRDDGSFDFQLIDINRMSFGHMTRRACMSNIKRYCSDPAQVYAFAARYAEIRDWDVYACMASLSIQRSAFEKVGDRKKQIKEWIHATA